jgi:hypothetical protein
VLECSARFVQRLASVRLVALVGDYEPALIAHIGVGVSGLVVVDRDLGELVALRSAAAQVCGRSARRASLNLGLVGLGKVGEECALRVLMTTHAPSDDGVGDCGSVRAAVSAAPLLEGRVLVVIDRAVCGTRLRRVSHAHARVVGRPRSPDGLPARVTAAHDRLMSIVGLLQNRDIRPIGNSGSDSGAPVI